MWAGSKSKFGLSVLMIASLVLRLSIKHSYSPVLISLGSYPTPDVEFA